MGDRYTLAGFYWEWTKRAWLHTLDRAKHWYGFAAIVAAFVALIVRDVWPDMSPILSWASWLPFGVFAAVFLATLARGLITAPYQIYVEADAKAQAAIDRLTTLTKNLEPALAFVPAGERTMEKNEPDTTTRLRLAVKNSSPSERHNHLEVRVVGWTDLATGQRTSLHALLYDLDNKTDVALNPDKVGYFNVALMRGNKRPPYMHLAPSKDHYGVNRINVGSHLIHVEASSEHSAPISADYRIEIRPDATFTFSPEA